MAGIAGAIHCGAYPEFVDIDKNTYNIDTNKLEDKLKKQKRVKAAIITDFAGQPSDWEDLYYLKKKYNIILINDNCHSIGATYKNNIGYALKYSDVSCLSFHPVKHITTGEGGAILTNNKKLSLQYELYRSHGIQRNYRNSHEPWVYKVDNLGFNYRLSDINAGLGISQLNKLDKFISFRKKIANAYFKKLQNIEELKLPYLNKDRTHSYHLYVLRINFKKINKKKRFFLKFLQRTELNFKSIIYQFFYNLTLKKILI